MNKIIETTKRDIHEKIFKGETDNGDKGAFICDLIMLGIFIWNQIFYGMNMWLLIILLAILGGYLFFFCIIAEDYYFTKTSLEIRHKLRKTVSIHYSTVFNYEAASRDSFINILQNNYVKIYYIQSNKKKVFICRPKDVASFIETLKRNCPEFYDDLAGKSKLEVFFNSENKKQ